LQVVFANGLLLTCADSSPQITNYQIVPGSDNCSGKTLGPYDPSNPHDTSFTCTVAIEYTPVSSTYGNSGPDYFLQLNSNEGDSGRSPVELIWNQNSPLRMTPNGSAVPGAIAMLNFGPQLVGQAGSTQTITLYNDPNDPSNNSTHNPNQSPLVFPAKPVVKGDYSEFDDCVFFLAVGDTCTMTVTFTPKVVGFDPGLITIFVQAANDSSHAFSHSQYVYLLGTGQ